MHTLGPIMQDRPGGDTRSGGRGAAGARVAVPAMAVALAAGLLALGALQAKPAHAQIALETAIVDFNADDPRRRDVEVTNTGEETLYIEATPRLVENPGTPEEARREIRNPRDLGLLVSPRKMVLEPGQRSLMRLSLLQRPGARDRIFRLRVRPRFNEFESEQSGVRVVVAYNMLVIARPPDARADLVGARDGKDLTLRNRGNSNALFVSGEQCAPGGDACQDLPTRRMYAGNEWRVTLPYETTEATWTVRTPEGLEERSW